MTQQKPKTTPPTAARIPALDEDVCQNIPVRLRPDKPLTMYVLQVGIANGTGASDTSASDTRRRTRSRRCDFRCGHRPKVHLGRLDLAIELKRLSFDPNTHPVAAVESGLFLSVPDENSAPLKYK